MTRRPKRPPHVWVVEMLTGFEKWEPCVACSLCPADARMTRRAWEMKCPADEFRVVKYVREDKGK